MRGERRDWGDGDEADGIHDGKLGANGGYDWAVFGGDRKQTEDGVVHFMKSPTVREVVASAGPMGIPTYAAGRISAAGRWVVTHEVEEHRDVGHARGRDVRGVGETRWDVHKFGAVSVRTADVDVTTPSKATLAPFAVGVLGDDGSACSANFISYKENYWLTPANASVSSGMYSTEGGEAISVVVSDSDGDLLDVGVSWGDARE